MNYIWNITGRCNLNCEYCWDVFKKTPEISEHQAQKILNMILNVSCNSLIFTGGEPLLRRDLFNLIQLANFNGIKKIKICTNGLLLKDRMDEIVSAPVSEIHVSLDSIDEKDTMFRKENKKVMENIEALLCGIEIEKTKVIIVSVLNYNKLDAYENLIIYASKIGAYVTFQLPAMVGNNKLSINIDDLEVDKYMNIFSSLETLMSRYSRQFEFITKDYLKLVKRYYLDGYIPSKCDAGEDFKIISPDGNFYDCYTYKNKPQCIQQCFEPKCFCFFRANKRAQKIAKFINEHH